MMDSELKQLLRDRADEARIDPTIPPGVLRRARRRRAGTVAMTGVVAAAVAVGALVGVRAALDRGEAVRPGGQEASAREVVGFVADFLRARLAGSGAEPFLSAEAERTYGDEVDGLSLYGGDRGPYGGYDIYSQPRESKDGWSIVVFVKWPDPQGQEDRFVVETLELGPGQDVEGHQRPLVIRDVFRGESRGAVKAFIEDFMEARAQRFLRGQGLIDDYRIRVHDYLSPDGLADYESEENGLSLYRPQGARLEYDLVSITPPLRGDHWQVRVRVRYERGASETTVLERLTVGPGSRVRGRMYLASLVVLEVQQELDLSGPDAPSGQGGPTGGEVFFPTRSENVRDVMQALLGEATLLRHDSCLFAAGVSGEELLVWPPGFRFEDIGGGRVVDPAGDVVATVGGPLPRMGGGVSTADFAEEAFIEGTIPDPCRAPGESVWIVGEIEGHPRA
jgi:hypothetical protein